MVKRLFISLLSTVALLLTVGCNRLESTSEGVGRLVLYFSSGGVETKASKEDGDLFSNILVIVAKDDGTVIGKGFKYLTAESNSYQMEFDNIPLDSYVVCAYANIDHTAWWPEIDITNIAEGDYSSIIDVNNKIDLNKTLQLSSGSVPVEPNGTGMLLTGRQEVTLSVEQTSATVSLQRPVARLQVLIRNHTGKKLRIDELEFSRFNPSSAYLLGRLATDGSPEMPDVSYTALPSLPSNPATTILATESEKTVYGPTLLFENDALLYKMYAKMTIDPDEATSKTVELTSTGDGLLPGIDIKDLPVGKVKQVLLVNPNGTNGRFFGANGNSIVSTDAKYLLEDTYQAKAADLATDETKRTQYVLNLEKKADGYHLTSPSGKDLFGSVDSNKGLTWIEEPASRSGNAISNEFNGYLSRFKASNGQYLWNNGNNSLSKSSNSGQGNAMWAFYEVTGSVLKKVETETHQVTPINYIRRNQDLTIVMNVYFEASLGWFTIEVEDWTTHESDHTFK